MLICLLSLRLCLRLSTLFTRMSFSHRGSLCGSNIPHVKWSRRTRAVHRPLQPRERSSGYMLHQKREAMSHIWRSVFMLCCAYCWERQTLRSRQIDRQQGTERQQRLGPPPGHQPGLWGSEDALDFWCRLIWSYTLCKLATQWNPFKGNGTKSMTNRLWSVASFWTKVAGH